MALQLVNLISPFSRPIKYYNPLLQGLLVFAHDDSSPIYQNEDDPEDPRNGQQVFYTEAYGSYYMELVSKNPRQGNEITATIRRNMQLGGNIDWQGKIVEKISEGGEKSKQRLILSYWGPQSRQLPNQNFSYGSDSKHNEIYMDGRYLDFAPYPVLGASLYKPSTPIIVIFNKGTAAEYTEEYPYALLVVCLNTDDNSDCVYMRPCEPFGMRVKHDEITDNIISARKGLFHEISNPQGWQLLTSMWIVTGHADSNMDSFDAYAASTPWFFNATGNAAAAMRYGSCTFNNLNEDVTEEHVPVVYLLSVEEQGKEGNLIAEIIVMPSDPPLGYTEKSMYEELGDYSILEPDPPYDGYVHYWDYEELTQSLSCYGQRTYMVDWEDDDFLIGKLLYNLGRSNRQKFFRGIDGDYYPDPPGDMVVNTGSVMGPPPDIYEDPDSEDTPVAKSWMGIADYVVVRVYRSTDGNVSLVDDRDCVVQWRLTNGFFHEGYHYWIPREWRVDNDHGRDFSGWTHQERYMYFADIRYGLYAAKEYVTKTVLDWLEDSLTTTKETGYVYVMGGNFESGVLNESDTTVEFKESVEVGVSTYFLSALPSDGPFGINYTPWFDDYEDQPYAEVTITRTTFNGGYLTDNDDESYFKPAFSKTGSGAFYDAAFHEYDTVKFRTIPDLLFLSADRDIADDKSGFASTYDRFMILSFVIKLIDGETIKYVNKSEQFSLDILRAGDRYYPISVV